MRDIKHKLALVRRYTGNRFSAARGYDLRKPMSAARVRTIERYYVMIEELTSRPHKVFVPPKGMKREAFEFTGQKAHPRFTHVILPLPDPTQKYKYKIDKTRPRGSRFVLINQKTKEAMWHIPADVFVEEYYEQTEGGDIWDEEEISPEFFKDVIDEYGERAGVFMIEAGEYHMWGTAGHSGRVGEKLASLFKQYGATNFDPYNKSSHFIGNWFRGVQVFGQDDAITYATERFNRELNRLQNRYGDAANRMMGRKLRYMRDGTIGEFYQGELQHKITVPGAPKPKQYKPKKRKTPKPRNRR